MTTKKFILSLFALVLTSVSAMAQSEPVLIDDVYYTLNETTREATVVEDPDGYSGRVDVPGVVDYNNWTYTVTAVGDGAFYKSTAVVVDLPATLRRIGRNAFANYAGQRIIIRSRNLEPSTDPWFNVARDKFTIYIDASNGADSYPAHFGNRIKWMDISEAPEAEKYFRILGHDVVPNTPDLLGDGTGRISVDADGVVCIRNLNNLDCGNEYFIDTNTENYIFVNGKNSINCTRGIRSLKNITFMKKDGVSTGAIDMTLNTPGATAISMHHEAKSTFLSLYDVDLCVRFTPAAANPRNTGAHLSDGRIKGIGSTLSSRLVIETQGGIAISCTSELPRPGDGAQYGANYELDATGSLAGDFVIDNYDPMRGALTTRKMWVSEDKQVYLSQGIFMYNYNTYHARFADSQLDAYGSQPVNGYMTMFGQSTTNSNYGISEWGYSESRSSYYSGDFVDWGPLIGEGWRTLNEDEFQGLIEKNDLLAGFFSCTPAKVCKEDGTPVVGTLLLPPTWKRWGNEWGYENPTTNDSFYDFTYLNGTQINQYKGDNADAKYPVIDHDMWQRMENDGAFFLPSAGYWGHKLEKDKAIIDPFDVREPMEGLYWTSTAKAENPTGSYGTAVILSWYPGRIYDPSTEKFRHFLVRLVRDVPAEEMDEKPDWDDLRKKYYEWLEDGINDVKVTAPAAPTKVLRGKQILIQRDGKTYNTAGMRVE